MERLKVGQIIQLSETDSSDLWDVMKVSEGSAVIKKHGKITREIKINNKKKSRKGIKFSSPLAEPETKTVEFSQTSTLTISPFSFVKVIS